MDNTVTQAVDSHSVIVTRWGQEYRYTHTHPEVEVHIRRDTDGRIYSEVRSTAAPVGGMAYPPTPHYVVIDRQSGRGMDESYVKSRAAALAILLGCKIVEDLRWPCCAESKKPCGCPVCRGHFGVRLQSESEAHA